MDINVYLCLSKNETPLPRSATKKLCIAEYPKDVLSGYKNGKSYGVYCVCAKGVCCN